MSESRIGVYNILRLIKRGGQGSVYLGYDRRLNRQVAIKVYALPRDRQARRQAVGEARRASAINDPRVVQIYDLVESRDHLALVMEYVPGCDLEEVLRNVRLSVGSSLRIGADLAAALAAATQQRLIHGDLKAANVLLTRDGRAKLADFGVARGGDEIPDEPPGEAAAGSLSALSPEHLLGQPLDLRSDFFALGCLLYRMLAGAHPFFSAGRLDTDALLYREPPPVEDLALPDDVLPGELVLLLAKLLQKAPQDRPQDTHFVRRQLRNALRELPFSLADNLAREARPFFRAESTSDIPLHLPSGLRRNGRSRLARRGLELWWQRFCSLRPSSRFVLVVVPPLLLVSVVGAALHRTPVRVHFAQPVIELAGARGEPGGFDERELMRVVYAAAEAHIGPIHASGAVEGRVYYAHLAHLEPREVVATSLRCSEVLCVFFVSRQAHTGEYAWRQALLPPQLPNGAWESAVAETVNALFP